MKKAYNDFAPGSAIPCPDVNTLKAGEDLLLPQGRFHIDKITMEVEDTEGRLSIYLTKEEVPGEKSL